MFKPGDKVKSIYGNRYEVLVVEESRIIMTSGAWVHTSKLFLI